MLFAPCIFIILVFEEVARAYYLSTACKTIKSYKKRGNKLTRVAYTRKMVCLANSSSKPQKILMRIKVQSQGWQIGRTTQAWGENAPDEESRLNEEGGGGRLKFSSPAAVHGIPGPPAFRRGGRGARPACSLRASASYPSPDAGLQSTRRRSGDGAGG